MSKRNFLFIIFIFSSLLLFSSGTKEKEIKTVVFWHPNTGKAGEVFEEIVTTFNQTIGKEKGIQIEAVYQGKANDVLTKVKAEIASGSVPDLAQMDATASLDMNSSTLLVPISSLNIDLSTLPSQAKAAFTSDRGLIALPFNASSLLFYYNKTLFDELGLKAPKTFDEFIEIAPLLVKKNSKGEIVRYAFSGVPTTTELTTFLGSQNGGSYTVNEKNGHLALPSRVLLKENGTYKAFLEKWKALYDTRSVNNITSGVNTEFASSRTASLFASSSNLSTIIGLTDGLFELGVAPVPIINENATGGVAVSGGAVFAFSDKEEVKEVIKYLLSEEVQSAWCEKTGYAPMNKNVYESASWQSFVEKNPLFKVAPSSILSSSDKVINLWVPSGYQIYYSFQENINSVCLDKLTIDEATDEIEKTIQSFLDSYLTQNLL